MRNTRSNANARSGISDTHADSNNKLYQGKRIEDELFKVTIVHQRQNDGGSAKTTRLEDIVHAM